MPEAAERLRPLWTCPECGKAFVNANSFHSCLNWPLDQHFKGRDRARALFNAFRAAVERTGPVTLVSNKTTVGFMTRTRFAGCQPRKNHLSAAVWLKRSVDSPRVRRVDQYGPRDFVIRFDIKDEADIDGEIIALLVEARRVGDQGHEHQSRRYRQVPTCDVVTEVR